MAEAFNCQYANIKHDVARGIPCADTQPEQYFIPTNKTFSNAAVVVLLESENYSKR